MTLLTGSIWSTFYNYQYFQCKTKVILAKQKKWKVQNRINGLSVAHFPLDETKSANVASTGLIFRWQKNCCPPVQSNPFRHWHDNEWQLDNTTCFVRPPGARCRASLNSYPDSLIWSEFIRASCWFFVYLLTRQGWKKFQMAISLVHPRLSQ